MTKRIVEIGISSSHKTAICEATSCDQGEVHSVGGLVLPPLHDDPAHVFVAPI
jgi:hypothetical protein